MNNEPTSADWELDSLLRNWSRDRTVDPATLDRLRQRITGTALAVSVRSNRRTNHRAVVIACGLSACLVAAVVLTSTDPIMNVREIATVSNVKRIADFGPRLAKLWSKTSEVFGTDLEWIGDLDGELLVGVKHEATATESGNRVCLAITLRVFDPAKQTWVNSWTGRITCPTGAAIDFSSADHRTTGAIWIQSQPDGRFAVSHWLSWKEHPEVSGPIDGSVPADESRVVADRIKDGQHVQVVHQIWRLGVG